MRKPPLAIPKALISDLLIDLFRPNDPQDLIRPFRISFFYSRKKGDSPLLLWQNFLKGFGNGSRKLTPLGLGYGFLNRGSGGEFEKQICSRIFEG